MAPVGVQLETGKKYVQTMDDNKQFITNIPKVEAEYSKAIADDLKSAIQRSIARKGLNFSGDLKNNVRVKASAKDGGAQFSVTANAYNGDTNYAAWHEYATQGHFVEVDKQNDPIQKWAKKHGMDAHTIFVQPINQTAKGSFMEPAVENAINQTRRKMNNGKNPLFKLLSQIYK